MNTGRHVNYRCDKCNTKTEYIYYTSNPCYFSLPCLDCHKGVVRMIDVKKRKKMAKKK